MKKIVTVLATLALVGSLAFAQEAEATENGSSDKNAATVSFENKLYSPLIDVYVSDDGTSAIFPYLYEQMKVNVESEYVDLEVQGRVYLNPTGTVFKSIDATSLWNGLMYDPDKTYFDINFKPGYGIELGLHHSITIPGSYLVIEDDYVAIGDIGCDGFTLGYTGVPGLHLAASFDVDNLFLAITAPGSAEYVFNTGFGGWYEFKKDDSEDPFLTIGAAFEYSRGNDSAYRAGAYISCAPVDGLNIYAGYTYNTPDDDLFIPDSEWGAVNFSLSYENSGFYCAVDYNSSLLDAMYAGLLLGYNINDNWAVEVTTTTETCYSDFGNGVFCVNPWAIWSINENHELSFGPEFYFGDGNFTDFTFPVKWIYKF